jgi:hypothetical protein
MIRKTSKGKVKTRNSPTDVLSLRFFCACAEIVLVVSEITLVSYFLVEGWKVAS